MRRRLRKKLRVREFRIDCFEVAFSLDPSLDTDHRNAVLDQFIGMIESSGLQCGGGGRADWSVVVESTGSRRSTTDEDRRHVLKWLEAHPSVIRWAVGRNRDGNARS